MPEIPKVGWGIIGAGDIAHRVMAPAMRECPHSELVAVTRTTLQGARDFARRHGARRGYDKLEDLLADPEVQAVYVATPVARHLPDTLAAAAAGTACPVREAAGLERRRRARKWRKPAGRPGSRS